MGASGVAAAVSGRARRVPVDTWALVGVSVVWLVVNARWIWLYRHGQLLDVDEAGYLGIAMNDYHAAMRGGFSGWLDAIVAPSIQAPLTTASTSVLFMVTGPRVVVGFAVPLLAGLATILLTHAMARRTGGRRLAWLCTALVACAPGIVGESRGYHFGITSAAVTAVALYLLMRRPGLPTIGVAVGFGVALGLMPLSRTLMIAFVPALVLAAVVQAATGPDRRRRLAHCGLALVVATAVAGSWLVFNGERVFRYLLGYGYGTQSAEYGTESGLLNPGAWLARLRVLLYEQYIPHTAVLLVGLAVAAVVVARRWPATGAARAVASPLFPPAVLVLWGYAVLLTSGNTGVQFALPLLPAMTILAVWGLLAVARSRVVSATVAGVCVLAAVPLLDLRSPPATPWLLDVPVLGVVTMTDGRTQVQSYIGEGLDTEDVEPISPAVAREWIAASDWAADQLLARGGDSPVTGFGFRDRLFNPNTVQLAVLGTVGYGIAMPQISPQEIGDTQQDYERWLTQESKTLIGNAQNACLLFTASGTQNEFTPVVDPDAMLRAAVSTGFTVVTAARLPNGRTVTLWQREAAFC